MNDSNKGDAHPIPGGIYSHSHRHITRDRQHVITAGEGCYVKTRSGERYLDYLLGQGPLICGHAHPHVTDAIQDQATRGTHFTLSSRPSLKLAERIIDASPCADHLRFTCTGSHATYIALRLARAYTGKEKILKFEGSYHGYHDYAMRSSSRAGLEELSRHTYPDGTIDSLGVVSGAAESVLVAPFNDLNTTFEIVTAHSDDIAGIIVEPIQRSLPPVDGFLAGLRDLADEHDITLIFDEVVTGFRLAWGGAQEQYGVVPDLATYGKTITGGIPSGAICGDREIMELANPLTEDYVYMSSTFNGYPLGAAAGNAVLDILERDETYRGLYDYSRKLRTLIDDVLADSGISGRTIGEGPIVDYVLTERPDVTDWKTVVGSDMEIKKRIDEAMIEEGILHNIGGKRYISTEHGSKELELTSEAFKNAVESVDT